MSNDLIRLGRKKDGGYILNKRLLDKACVLLSFGISTDWTFEAEFYSIKKNSNVLIKAFDFSVGQGYYISRAFVYLWDALKLKRPFGNILMSGHFLIVAMKYALFFNNAKKQFHKKGIDSYDHDVFISFDTIMNGLAGIIETDDIIIKMDIEGFEYAVLEQAINHKEFISTFIIEFHDLEKFGSKFETLIDLTKSSGYVITHIHPNNGGGYIENTNLPRLLEVTLSKSIYFSESELNKANTQSYPLKGLDYPCVTTMDELPVVFD